MDVNSASDDVPASIDAVVHSPIDEEAMPESQGPQADGLQDVTGKRRTRKRMLLGLHRIASTGSLARMGRSAPSTNYRSGAGGTLSCISLASSGYPLHYTTSYESDFAPQFSTAPTSVAGTPSSPTPRVARSRSNTLGKDTPASVGLPPDLRSTSPPSRMGQCISEVEEDCTSRSVTQLKKPSMKRRKDFNFWKDMPEELRMEILSYLKPKELVRCSTVSKTWHSMCFDGQ